MELENEIHDCWCYGSQRSAIDEEIYDMALIQRGSEIFPNKI